MRIIITLIFLTITFQLFSQNANINTVKDAVSALADNFPQEKVYLQYDKPAYAPGETIWFKAYMLVGANTDDISKTLYVDFLDASGRLIKHCVQPVYQSSASGDCDVPLDYKDRTMFVRAYTKWMLNFDSAFFYRKAVQIVQIKPSIIQKTSNTKTNVKFLPEGGDLIEGIESKVAFKAVNADGRPAAIQGTVVDKNGQQVTQFKTVHDGMGSFLLTPANGETYTAKWKDASGNTSQTVLPQANPSGVTLKIYLQKASRGFAIQRSENAPDNLKKIYVIGTMQQHLVYFASANLQENAVTGGSIPIGQLPSGILQITLFDSAWNPVAERITFINNDDYHFEPEAGFAELGLDKRKSNTLVIDVPDSITANLSVAVTDENIGIDSSDNIVSRLLLTSDLRGTVFNPSYYFASTADSLQQNLDLVMLTNGWRRIDWQNIVNNKMPTIKYQNDTSYLTLSGKVFGASETDLKQGALILMMLNNKKDTAHKVEQAMLNKDASFSVSDKVIFDTTKVFYKVAGSTNLSDASAVTFNGSMPSYKFSGLDTVNHFEFTDTATENYRRWLAEEQQRLLKLQQGATLQDVTVTTKAKSAVEILDEKYTSPLFNGGDAYQFDVMSDPFAKSALSVLTYLQGKVAGLAITTTGGGINGSGSATWRGGTPDFYMNEQPVDINTLASINMADIAYVKVFRPPFMGTAAGGGSSGAIAIYTRRGGDEAQTDTKKGLPYKLVIGYTVQKEFYSPNYATFNNRNDDRDLRTTLYWNPMLLSNQENHSFRIHFFNNDITKGFRIILEGMSSDGRLTHVEKVVE